MDQIKAEVNAMDKVERTLLIDPDSVKAIRSRQLTASKKSVRYALQGPPTIKTNLRN